MLRIPRIPTTFNNEIFVSLGGNEWPADYDYLNYKAKNTDYDVWINNRECEVRECRVSAMPFNRPWPGRQRDIFQSESAGFITFTADEEVNLHVKCKKQFQKAVVRPLSKAIVPTVKDNDIFLKLTHPGSYVLELDDEHNALHIFFNSFKEFPDEKKATYYFGPGIHFPGVINVKDNDVVYIDEEAIVFGSINSIGAKNVRVYGGGVLDNSCEERITEHCYENFTKGTFRLYNCEDVIIEDIILLNSSTWVLALFNCNNITIDNVKIIGHWRYNTDGIDIVNSSNVSVQNSFVRSFDDTINIKGIYDYDKTIENIVVHNCVLWCDWGLNCGIGVETAAPEFRNIVFRNSDLIHSSYASLAIVSGCHTEIHDVTFEGLNIEYQKSTLPQIMQQNMGHEYDGYGKINTPFLIKATNESYAIRTKNKSGVVRKTSPIQGNIHDIVYKNLHVYMEEGLPKPIIRLCSYDKNVKFTGFCIDGIFVNDNKQEDLELFTVETKNVENVIVM